jgi:hypothetical protein
MTTGTIKRHKPTGAIIWFPNLGNTGVVIESDSTWKVGQTYADWWSTDLEEMPNLKLELTLKTIENA